MRPTVDATSGASMLPALSATHGKAQPKPPSQGQGKRQGASDQLTHPPPPPDPEGSSAARGHSLGADLSAEATGGRGRGMGGSLLANRFLAKLRRQALLRQSADSAALAAAEEAAAWEARTEAEAAAEASKRGETAVRSLRRPVFGPLRFPRESAALQRLLSRLRLVRSGGGEPSLQVAEDVGFVRTLQQVFAAASPPFFTTVSDLVLSFAVDRKELGASAGRGRRNKSTLHQVRFSRAPTARHGAGQKGVRGGKLLLSIAP